MAAPAPVAATTPRGRAVVVLGVILLTAGLWWSYLLVAGLGGVLVVLVVAEVVAVLTAGAVSVRRQVEPRVVLRQEPCQGRLRVEGRRRRGLVRLDLADQVDGTLVPVHLPDVVSGNGASGEGAGGEGADGSRAGGPAGAEVTYDIPTPRRGLVDVGPVQVRLSGLTGMAARSTDSGSVDQVRVLPRRIPVAGMMPGHRRSVVGGDDSAEVGGTDIVGLHEYTMGDDLRRLHWATSARTGTLMVREDADPAQPHVHVALDDRRDSYLGDADLFEESVEIAAALCREGIEAGHPVRLRTMSGRSEIDVPGSASRQPRREQRDLDYLLAEIDLVEEQAAYEATGGLDIAVAVTGVGADLREITLGLGPAATRVVTIADPAPLVAAHHEGGLLVLRGATSVSLTMLWDEAIVR